jgi:hypothetical protein
VTSTAEVDSRDNTAFWTMIVAFPGLLSVLRLWVEAGGDLQTTLLLVNTVGPASLIAAFLITGVWLLSASLVAVFTLGSMTRESLRVGQQQQLFARWSVAASGWLRVLAFGAAALTWDLLFLPLLVWAALVAFRWWPFARLQGRGRILAVMAGGAVYTVLMGPTLVAAIKQADLVPALLVGGPPLFAAARAGEGLTGSHLRRLGLAAHVATAVLVIVAALPVLRTPVLPLTVITVQQSPETVALTMRGYLLSTDDVSVVYLKERGGVVFLDADTVTERALCISPIQAPRYELWILNMHVEESILQGLGRRLRSAVAIEPRCWIQLEDFA